MEGCAAGQLPTADDAVQYASPVRPLLALPKGQLPDVADRKPVPGIVNSATPVALWIVVVLAETRAAIGVAPFFSFLVGDGLRPGVARKEAQSVGHLAS